MKRVQMTLDEDLVKDLDRAAKKLGTTRSGFIREALRSALEEVRISGVGFDEAWKSRDQGRIADTAVFIISRDLLIRNKRAANRDKD